MCKNKVNYAEFITMTHRVETHTRHVANKGYGSEEKEFENKQTIHETHDRYDLWMEG
jgi:hypothetical protein